MEKNQIAKLQFLSGPEEAAAFTNKDYFKLHQSTLRKVDAMASIAEMAYDGTLKTNANWRQRYGLHPSVIIELIKENKVIGAIVGVLALLSAIITIVAYFKR